jgi:alpha-mannosidase
VQKREDLAPEVEDDEWQIHARGAENRFLTLQIEEDGILTITHKATGITYRDLNRFEDVADTGDAYTFCPLPGDTPVTTGGDFADVYLICAGANVAEFEIVYPLALPPGLTPDRGSRISDTILMPITSIITLERDCPYLRVQTSFFNSASDHKLSAIFPTDLTSKVAHVDESFAVVERQIELPPSEGWVEDPTPLMHQRTFTDLSNGKRGLAILNRGSAAVEVTRIEGGTRIGVPLVRAVGWLSRDDLWIRRIAAGPLVPTPGAQCIGLVSAEYAIFPHNGDWESVYRQAYNYAAPITAARGDTHAGIDLHDMNITRDDPSKITHIPFPRGGELPDTHSFVSVEGEGIVLSALRRGADQAVVRFYNVTARPTTAVIISGKALKAAHRLNLNEESLESLPIENARTLKMEVRPGQIVTVGLAFG